MNNARSHHLPLGLGRIAACFVLLFAAGRLSAQTAPFTTGGYSVHTATHGVTITSSAGNRPRQIELATDIEGLHDAQPVQAKTLPGELSLTRTLVDAASAHRCTLVDRFSGIDGPATLRWEVEIRCEGAPWSAPVHSSARYRPDAKTRFWTAWSNPQDDGEPGLNRRNRWNNPLVPTSIPTRRFYYGAPYVTLDQPRIGFSPTTGNLIALALASFLQPDTDTGLSLIFSPADPLLDMTLDVSANGSADFAQFFQRLGGNRTFRFSLDLVQHEADWRGPLRWMVGKYPSYFEPALAAAHELDGTSAYSTSEAPVDVPKFRAMDFQTNWKASFDFPYMGMFLPPVDSESWPRFAGDSSGKVDPAHPESRGRTSIANMADYSARMRQQGFHVLNYFNVTEFGADIAFPAPPRKAQTDRDLWKDPNDWLYQRLRSSLLLAPPGVKGVPAGSPYYTWGKAVTLDCGEPSYQQFLLEQARRHMQTLPQSSGICIDRMDWLRLYNQQRDDGQSWFNNAPARSLYNSWHDLTSKLLPLMHNAGKVVFVNNHVKRIDLLENIDGIFDEFGSHASSLNTTAFLTLRRPALGWVNDEQVVMEDPDGFFQRFLLLGVFPMAPFPGNDHSLLPSAPVDKEYLAYGSLMKAMNGRIWVLTPRPVQVENSAAQANMFAVPGGFVIPVMLGGSASSARVIVRSAKTPATVDALAPGAPGPLSVRQSHRGKDLVLDVPLRRGCAMVRIR